MSKTRRSPVEQNVGYEYDDFGNMTKVLEGSTEVASYTYDKKGQLITTTNSNGTVETNTYNLAGLVTSTLNKNSNSIISHYIYTYYYDGQQKSKTDSSGKTSYIYDEAGQLIREAKEVENEVTEVTEYSYDANGNRIKLTETEGDNITETVYTYDANDRLKSEKIGDNAAITYEYDKNGNNISKSDGTVQTFDVLNRMTSYKASDGTTTTYTYYPDDMRRSKKVGTTYILTQVWVGSDITLDMQGEAVKSYVHGNKLVKEGSTWYNYNAHGDVTALTDSNGTVTRNYDYNAFGVQLTEEDENDTNPYRYCGEYFDFESGYTYLRARYYDTSIGRFINEDPALDGYNWYVYCGNNPIGMIDPSGMWGDTVHGNITKEAIKRAKRFRKLKLYKNKKKYINNKLEYYSKYPDYDESGLRDNEDWHGKKEWYKLINLEKKEAKKYKKIAKMKTNKVKKRELKNMCKYIGIRLHTIQDHQAHMIGDDYARDLGAGKYSYYEMIKNPTYLDYYDIEDMNTDKPYILCEDGVTELHIAEAKYMHYIIADNPRVDFENGKWVYKESEGNRYIKAISDSKKYLNDFTKKRN